MKPRVLVLSLLIRQMLSTIILVIGNHLFPALSMSIVSRANALVVMIAEKKSLTTIAVTTITQEKEREGQKE